MQTHRTTNLQVGVAVGDEVAVGLGLPAALDVGESGVEVGAGAPVVAEGLGDAGRGVPDRVTAPAVVGEGDGFADWTGAAGAVSAES